METVPPKVRVLLVDDHPFVRDGLAGLLRAQSEYEVVAEANTVVEGLSACRDLRPDLIIVDMRLPDGDGGTILELARAFGLPAVVLSAFRTEDDVIAAARSGARGYLMKTAHGQEVLSTLRRVLAGEDVLADELTPAQKDRLLQKDLTPMEIEILRLLGRGWSNEQIGRERKIAANTVKTHLRHIFAKLDVANRSQAAAIAIRRGLNDK